MAHKKPPKRRKPTKAENAARYQRRIIKGTEEGKTRQAARGHARVATGAPDERIAQAFTRMESGAGLAYAAKEAGVAPERLRAFARAGGARQERIGTRLKWIPRPQFGIKSTVLIYGLLGPEQTTLVLDPANASLAGYYQNAVRDALKHSDASALYPFTQGKSDIIRDMEGIEYTLIADLDVIRDLLISTDADAFGSDKPMSWRAA